MKNQKENLWIPKAIIIAILLIIAIALNYFFKSENLKNYKSDLEDEIKQLKCQIRLKERNVRFFEEELKRLKANKECIIDFALRLYRTIKLIVFCLILLVGVAGYAFYNLYLLNAIAMVAPVAAFCYYGLNISVKNRVGDFGKALQLVQDYFVDIIFHLKKFDVNLINMIEEKLAKEIAELENLKLQLAT